MHWTNVHDGYEPNDSQDCLTYWSDGSMEVIRYDLTNREMFDGKMIANAVMTHWHPLPEPPEEQ